MKALLEYLNQFSFAIEFALSCMIFLLPLEKKPWGRLRIPACVLLIIFGCDRAYFLTVSLGLHPALSIFEGFILASFSFWFCARMTVPLTIVYAACAFAVQHMGHVITSFITTVRPMTEPSSQLLEAVVFALVLPLCYALFARKMPRVDQDSIGVQQSLRSVSIVLPFALFLSMFAEEIHAASPERTDPLFLICRVYAFLCCAYVLWIHTSLHEKSAAEMELRTQRILARKQKEQYEISRENIDLINKKCHDLKHQVAALRHIQNEEKRNDCLDEIEHSIMIYDSVVKTGNDALDIILTERSLSCERQGITWTCMADGSCLNFMDPVDLYTVFGNILDNAMESVQKLSEPEKKIIALNLYARKNMAILQVENYYEESIRFSDGLPVTGKQDKGYHGYGIRSIRSTIEKYNGTVTISTEDSIFCLSIVIPIP